MTHILCKLWSSLDGSLDFITQLQNIISAVTGLEPWVEAFVRTPAAIEYCSRRLIRRYIYSNRVYLLKTTQMNGTHAELFTYCLYQNMLKNFKVGGRVDLVRQLAYTPVITTDEEPCITLNIPYGKDFISFEIEYQNSQFAICIPFTKASLYPIIQAKLLRDLGFFESDWIYQKLTSSDLVEGSIIELFDNLKLGVNGA